MTPEMYQSLSEKHKKELRQELKERLAMEKEDARSRACDALMGATLVRRPSAAAAPDAVPHMPLDNSTDDRSSEGHRERNPFLQHPYNACVARPVGKKERKATPAAEEAVLKEWARLRAAGCWDESKVCEWTDVRKAASKAGHTVHVGMIFEIVVEKGAELPAGSPGRKFKGRVVFQGNHVLDQNYDHAMFNELGSCPATMEAAKAADVYGLFKGNTVEQADAEQAYAQAKLGGDVPTWVRLPRDRWPKEWHARG
jgi:hypothetical protein